MEPGDANRQQTKIGKIETVHLQMCMTTFIHLCEIMYKNKFKVSIHICFGFF